MPMQRRSLLAAMLAACAAPAYVKVSALMPLYVPPVPKIWTPIGTPFGDGDFTLEGWIRFPDDVDELRVTKGVARYQGTFADPLYAGVALLLHADAPKAQHLALTSKGFFVDGQAKPGPDSQQKAALQKMSDIARSMMRPG